MRCSNKYTYTQLESVIIKLLFLGTLLIGSSAANAASVTGEMGLTGGFTYSGGSDLSDATILDLTSATGTSGTGDIGSMVTFGTSGTVINSPFTFKPSTAVPNLLTIGGWQIDIGTIAITDQTTSILTLSGTGAISGNGLDLTPTQWTLSADFDEVEMIGSYSMTITAVPVPAAVWLFGSGLIGLIGIARRKSA